MSIETGAGQIAVRIFGYCHATPAEIAALFQAGREREIVHLGGNFVIVASRGLDVWIVTAPYGVVAYFYAVGATGFSHGKSVGDVLRQCRTPWRWNVEALADLFALEHLTGESTLHAAVMRTPAASVLHWKDKKLERWSATWNDVHAPQNATGSADRMVDALCEEVARCAGSSPVLSASGGFDSRVLLAALLAAGKRPELVVQGYANSTDRLVVEAMGRELALKVRTVELRTEDYLAAAPAICRATSGTKPAGHWHTYLYTAKSALHANDRFFVGANGEFARSYFLDKGVASLAADCLPARWALTEFWKRKLKSTLTRAELSGVSPELAAQLERGAEAQARHLAKPRSAGRTLEQLDHFYLRERVRHFIGNGLALYGLSAAWRTPLLSVPWVAEAERLPRSWKLGSNWHRHAIARLCPQLLDFPEEQVGPTMARAHAPLYWLRSRRRQRVVQYVDYRQVFADERMLSLLREHAADVDDLIDTQTLRKILDEHRSTGTRQRAISILLGLAVWRRDAHLH